ncbi:conserved Plasmodium protein, unknown function [Plasmodium knowlesi strain H]|uniref:Uncharacterized protein n=3 Tax=Plasmodium knowlesi TaxID=5850 RepID=A0A5K1VPA7_PLAKH|nr:conserved Plasmodium protein, unknown function [Plasmodium knowlesi strain H]OTN68646.1 Uncharacterized protein PKNOH_S01017700 [Plasmodium knowlesi]CAA9986174.1 conserved Plasmodium protein, unknown function [Plasmodium knowlesi strain H]SBO25370.1 conserved Plasmodium protein, unknown function [Plasmodium knowlesi strain H]SBO27668.1 conserved Plasmodium protein, unknown function [Plasmodium knowlesi strain H]VVS75648.1 conserved Plasmodium protein, unknown function [Plasmodium knowlesi s|eukprot:XP_002257585.1 hypothetical protein, conserved in Plasmodium species [Plasmodium knowlesi strain H]
MHMSDVPPPGGEESTVNASAGEVTKNGDNQDLTAGGSDAGCDKSDGCHAEKKHAEDASEEVACEAKKVRKSLEKADKTAKKNKKKKAKKEAKKKDKEVAKKGEKKKKKVAVKEAKAKGKGNKNKSIRTDDTFSTDSENELYNDDNLFMPRALKNNAHKKENQKSKTKEGMRKKETNQISKKKNKNENRNSKKKKKNNMKSKFCTAECLPLDHYSEAFENDLASYASSGFKKYLMFLKNYKTTVGVEDKVVTKKPRHMYV